jgi:hypothetical protein
VTVLAGLRHPLHFGMLFEPTVPAVDGVEVVDTNEVEGIMSLRRLRCAPFIAFSVPSSSSMDVMHAFTSTRGLGGSW